MFTVQVEKECGCFRKSDLQNHQRFEDKDQALSHALSMAQTMNEKFCQKHEFRVMEEGEQFKIAVSERGRSGGCCGGGHCS